MPASATVESLKETNPLLYAGDTPLVGEQFKEFQRAGGMSQVSVARDRNLRLRYNRWPGRTSDFRKHRKSLGKDAVPWENAWDHRVPFVDAIIEDLTDVCCTAFERSQLKTRATEAQDLAQKGYAEIVLNHYRDRMRDPLRDEVEYLAQFGFTNGAAVFQVGWETCVALRREVFTLEEIAASAQQAVQALMQMPEQEVPPDMREKLQQVALLGMLILDPAGEAACVEILQLFARDLAAQLFAGRREAYGDGFLAGYELSAKLARKCVRDLRETGRGELPAPYLAKDEPCVVAREPGVDYFHPPEMTDLQSSPWHIVREFLTQETVLARQTEGWDAEWCREAIKTAGQQSAWTDSVISSDSDTFDNDDEIDAYNWRATDSKNGLVEVIHFFKRYVDEDGLPCIKCTIWSPHRMRSPAGDEDFHARHYDYEDLPGQYPFVGFRWQKKGRQFGASMGVPQIAGCAQQAIKCSLDMLRDRQEMEINPERVVSSRLGLRYQAGPGTQHIVKSGGPDKAYSYVEAPTGNPALAFQLIEDETKRMSEYFGLINAHVLPAKWQSKLQRMVEKFLGSSAEMWGMVWQLIQRRATPEMLERIAGGQPNFPSDPQDIAAALDVSLFFDVKDLDMEFTFKKLQAVMDLAVSSDRGGLIDFAALTRMVMASIDPTYATALLGDKQEARQSVFKDVRGQLANISAGFEADYVEMDPAAQMKLEFAQQLIFGDQQGQGGNPKYQQALQADPVVQERVQKYMDNLQQSLKQQDNKMTGRLGVKQGVTA